MADQEQDSGEHFFHREGDSILFDKPEEKEKTDREKREREQHEFNRSQAESNKRIAYFTKWLVAATFCTIVVGIWQGVIAQRAAKAAQSSADAAQTAADASYSALDLQDIQMKQNRLNNARSEWMQDRALKQSAIDAQNAVKASQDAAKQSIAESERALDAETRPWIGIEIKGVTASTIESSGPSGAISVELKYSLHNYGTTPAIRQTSSFYQLPEAYEQLPFNHTQACNNQLVNIKNRSITSTPVFPSQTISERDLLDRYVTVDQFHILIGCVAYQSGTSDEVRTTVTRFTFRTSLDTHSQIKVTNIETTSVWAD